MAPSLAPEAVLTTVAYETRSFRRERTMADPVLAAVDSRGVATVALNRPEVGNAYDDAMIEGLLTALDMVSARGDVRALLLNGNGRHFQAGADLSWARSISTATMAENERASRATAEAVDRLNRLPIPTVALVQGACFGGGTGIISACDVVIAADNAMFAISEVRWGLTAAIIIPQLADAISARQLRRYALTGERFDALEARRIGLAHMVVPLAELGSAGQEMVDRLLENGPAAIAETKALILQSAWGSFDRKVFEALIASHAAKRKSPEAAEGLASFAEKRAARWTPQT